MIRFKGEACLLITAIVWGTAFIFQKMGMDHIGPFYFGAFRFIIGALALLPVILIAGKANNHVSNKHKMYITGWGDKTLIKGAIFCGITCFAAGTLLQVGLVYTTAGKAGFITCMDVVFVPIILLFMKQKVHPLTWTGIAIAMVGLYLLCITDGLNIKFGDGLIMLSAVACSFQIIFIDYYAERVDVLKLAFLQFMISGILSIPPALMFETINLQDVIDCAGPILYVALLEVSLAFTLQIIGQKYTPPAIATVIVSLESVFSVVAAALILGEIMTAREIIGGSLMFIAFIIAQIPDMDVLKDRAEHHLPNIS
jgi:drug/metabolite transporter (DMT)-like permease